MGCICANGQHKFFCERHRMDAGDARCICCYGRAAAERETAKGTHASPGTLTCCGSKRVARGGGQPALGTDRPCRPVLDRPELLSAAKATLNLDQADHTPLFVATSPPPATGCGAWAMPAYQLPPPPDLVTTLTVLLI